MKLVDLSFASSCGGQDSRCLCGSLLARLRMEGVELKCRRCKRVVIIPWGAAWAGKSEDADLRDEEEKENQC